MRAFTTAEEVYREIRDSLTSDHLKKITIDIINAYRNRRFRRLRRYVSVLNLEDAVKTEKLFALLVQTFHPDRLSFIMKQAEECRNGGDFEGLQRLYKIYFFDIDEEGEEEKVEFEAEYAYGKDDFGYRETDITEDEYRDEAGAGKEYEENGFIETLRRYFFGGLDQVLTESDLSNLDGELDLSDYDLGDLSGIENCIYLEELNLSGNGIEKIGRLSALVNLESLYLANNEIGNVDPLEGMDKLRILDISFNRVSDIRVLEGLPSLEYVNILGNPVRDYTPVNKLAQRGVIVVVEEGYLI